MHCVAKCGRMHERGGLNVQFLIGSRCSATLAVPGGRIRPRPARIGHGWRRSGSTPDPLPEREGGIPTLSQHDGFLEAGWSCFLMRMRRPFLYDTQGSKLSSSRDGGSSRFPGRETTVVRQCTLGSTFIPHRQLGLRGRQAPGWILTIQSAAPV
jgi:hypothetical protein